MLLTSEPFLQHKTLLLMISLGSAHLLLRRLTQRLYLDIDVSLLSLNELYFSPKAWLINHCVLWPFNEFVPV